MKEQDVEKGKKNKLKKGGMNISSKKDEDQIQWTKGGARKKRQEEGQWK
jgi:hypothetical protein